MKKGKKFRKIKKKTSKLKIYVVRLGNKKHEENLSGGISMKRLEQQVSVRDSFLKQSEKVNLSDSLRICSLEEFAKTQTEECKKMESDYRKFVFQ